MGRHKKNWGIVGSHLPVVAKAPLMKYGEAARMADKNAKTIVKVSQLLEIVHDPEYESADPDRYVEKYVEKLKKRINRRLKKLAKWSDSSSEERQSEFRVFHKGYPASSSSRTHAAPRPSSNVMTIGGGLPSSLSASRAASLNTPSYTIGGGIAANQPQPSAFPLLASALAEHRQRNQNPVTQSSSLPAAAISSSLDSVRERLQKELQQKDSQRDELIDQLKSELRGLIESEKQQQEQNNRTSEPKESNDSVPVKEEKTSGEEDKPNDNIGEKSVEREPSNQSTEMEVVDEAIN